MKKFSILGVLLVFILSTTVMADTLYADFYNSAERIRVDFVGSKIPTWGCHDVEGVQYDRFVLDENRKPQIYLEVYGDVGKSFRLSFLRFSVSKNMAIWGTAEGIPGGTEFQIKFLIWKDNQEIWAYWPLGPDEPLPANFNGKNVEIIKASDGSYIFRTKIY